MCNTVYRAETELNYQLQNNYLNFNERGDNSICINIILYILELSSFHVTRSLIVRAGN